MNRPTMIIIRIIPKPSSRQQNIVWRVVNGCQHCILFLIMISCLNRNDASHAYLSSSVPRSLPSFFTFNQQHQSGYLPLSIISLYKQQHTTGSTLSMIDRSLSSSTTTNNAAKTTPPSTSNQPITSTTSRITDNEALSGTTIDINDNDDFFQRTIKAIGNPYISAELYPPEDPTSVTKFNHFVESLHEQSVQQNVFIDPFWEQIKLEAQLALNQEAQAGPQLYTGVLSQPNLLYAICTVIAHEIESELLPATMVQNLFLDLLSSNEYYIKHIRYDLQAVATRDPSMFNAMDAILFHNGFHALVCYRVGHILWLAGRTGLAYYMQSVVSRRYAADIHPASTIGYSTYLRVGDGVVIGETAVVGNDVSILQGVTLGGTGKEKGDRHPKVDNGVIIQQGGTILGNIKIGEGSLVLAKSIVTKPVPALAIVSGVPARIERYRNLTYFKENIEELLNDPLQDHLIPKYLQRWQGILKDLDLEI